MLIQITNSEMARSCCSNVDVFLLILVTIFVCQLNNGKVRGSSLIGNLAEAEADVLKAELVENEGRLNLIEDKIAGLSGLIAKLTENVNNNNNNVLADVPEKPAGPIQTDVPENLASAMSRNTVYTRWGSKNCSGPGTKLVYTGYAAGSHYNNEGGAGNTLCLPEDPDLERISSTDKTVIYGAEYQTTPLPEHDHDVPCSVCEAARSSSLMIPAKNVCPPEWSLEYTGYLMAGLSAHKSATEYLCVERVRESLDGGQSNNNGRLFYFVRGVCGSLRCPPYNSNEVFTCAVCTK